LPAANPLSKIRILYFDQTGLGQGIDILVEMKVQNKKCKKDKFLGTIFVK